LIVALARDSSAEGGTKPGVFNVREIAMPVSGSITQGQFVSRLRLCGSGIQPFLQQIGDEFLEFAPLGSRA
jgi:hypothetical protein